MNPDPKPPGPPYWMPHLCQLADAVDAAETRRVAAQTALAQAQADADLEAAFTALYRYYLRLPYQIRLTRGSMGKIARLVSAWLRHTDRHQTPPRA